MTLTEARKTLERYRPTIPDDELGEAIDTAISVLPRESARPSAGERLGQIREAILDAKGFDPFGTRKRDREMATWRQCVWIVLRREGYTTTEIGKVSGYNHATVYWGVSRLRGYLACGDRLSLAIWQDFSDIMAPTV